MSEPQPKPLGEQERLNALLVRYGPAVRGFIGRRVRSAADADDLTQEVFARILGRAEAGPIENVEGYLFQAAANLLRERGRQSSLRAAAPAIELGPELIGQDEEQTPERILLGKDAYNLMVAALLELPERTRTVFILSRFEEVKGPEIARRLGVSISAVEKHMMRALAHLRARVR
jgi:RNA polymerase sigma factor (sigma-70 family)